MGVLHIYGSYNGHRAEEIDEASTPREAEYLLGEYRMAFGSGWDIYVKEWKHNPRDKVFV